MKMRLFLSLNSNEYLKLLKQKIINSTTSLTKLKIKGTTKIVITQNILDQILKTSIP